MPITLVLDQGLPRDHSGRRGTGFSELSMDSSNARFWALVAFNLTVAARETYVPQTEEIAEPAKLRTYNEMLHLISSYLVTAQTGVGVQSDSWLIPALTEMAERSGVAGSLKWAIEDAQRKTLRTSHPKREIDE
jgi:hypothetical protein